VRDSETREDKISGQSRVKGRYVMVKVALFVRLEAKPGKEKEVENFLMSGLPIVQAEPATTAWFRIRLGPPHSAPSMPSRMRQAVRLI
jgi:hypothetical protein